MITTQEQSMWRTEKIIQDGMQIMSSEIQSKTIRSGSKEKPNGGGMTGVMGRPDGGIHGDNTRVDKKQTCTEGIGLMN